MATTPRYNLPLMADATEQQFSTYSDAMRIIDGITHTNVVSATNTPPGSPAEGDAYIVTATATGAWAGEEDNIAYYINAAWIFFAPVIGWIVWDIAADAYKTWDGATWATIAIGVTDTPIGVQTMWVQASSMIPRTTNPPAAGSVELTTNKVMLETLDFDATSAEYAQFLIAMPKSWNEGTFSFIPYWSHSTGAAAFGVVWKLQALALGNDDAMDGAYGTAQSSSDTGGTADDVYVGPESSAITAAGTPAEHDMVSFQFFRDPADGSDTLDIDARLHGIKLLYTVDAANDA